jgi:hypothetical protein
LQIAEFKFQNVFNDKPRTETKDEKICVADYQLLGSPSEGRDVLVDSGKVRNAEAQALLREANELVAISITSINTARKRPDA